MEAGAADRPEQLREILRMEKDGQVSGGIYHKIQIELTWNSNHMEGSTLTPEQTRYIYETQMLPPGDAAVNVDDIVETANHFRCVDRIIEEAADSLTEDLIRELHLILKNGTSDSRKSWFRTGDWKQLPNEVGGQPTSRPDCVAADMAHLLADYEERASGTLEDLLDFHYRFERIHPFQDGNGRVGRLILFKECLRWNLVPFIISEDLRLYYYRGLGMWEQERGWLRDTCLTAQDRFRTYLDYFGIAYDTDCC